MFEGKLKWIRIWHGMKRRNILRHTKMNIENLSERRVKGRWNVMSSFFSAMAWGGYQEGGNFGHYNVINPSGYGITHFAFYIHFCAK